MKAIELAEKFYNECGKPMLEKKFGEVLPCLAVGYVGSGSDRFGYDDEVSRDHDFEPGFAIFLPNEKTVDRRTEFLLARAYDKLPEEFCGFKREVTSPVGGARNGVIRTADFYKDKIGNERGELDIKEWLFVPDNALAEATNGKVFYDGLGEFTAIRDKLLDMPENARKKRLAGAIMTMAQSGIYNYERCLKHGENEAAQLAAGVFADAALRAFFLFEKKYMPFYKWSFRAAKEYGGEEYAKKLAVLLSGDIYDEKTCKNKIETINEISNTVKSKAVEQSLSTENISVDLERHAYSINNGISDPTIRNMSIFATA